MPVLGMGGIPSIVLVIVLVQVEALVLGAGLAVEETLAVPVGAVVGFERVATVFDIVRALN